MIKDLEVLAMEAQDNLLKAKIAQASQSNKYCSLTFLFEVGGQVKLSTLHQQDEFKKTGDKWTAKFMPHFDGPYTIIDIDDDHSTITLDLLNMNLSIPSLSLWTANKIILCPTLLTNDVVVTVLDTLYAIGGMDLKKTIGCLGWNSKTLECSTSGWPNR